MSIIGLSMALSISASVKGRREKPGPRSPTCRELTYPAPRGSLVLPASSGKRLLPRDTYDSVAKRLARRSHRAEPIRHSGIEPNQASPRSFGSASKPTLPSGSVAAMTRPS